MGTCLECDENFYLDEGVDIGDIVVCPKCKTRHEVINTAPMTLDYAEDEEGDA